MGYLKALTAISIISIISSCVTTENIDYFIEKSDNSILDRTKITVHKDLYNSCTNKTTHGCLSIIAEEYNSRIDASSLELELDVKNNNFWETPWAIFAIPVGLLNALTGIPPLYFDEKITIDAKLKSENVVLGEYHTDGIEEGNWTFGIFDYFSGREVLPEIDRRLSFKKGMKEIFNQIENDNNVKAYEDKRIEAEKKAIEAAKLAKERFKKKYGKPECPTNLYNQAFRVVYAGDSLSSNCIYYLNEGWFLVFQQSGSGTLVQSRNFPNAPTFLVFVTKNSTDGNLVDGATVKGGYFSVIGKHSYQTVMGSKKTVYKLKRLSTE